MKTLCGNFLLATILLAALPAFSQEAPPSDHWAPLRSLVGSWHGEESGLAGEGNGSRTYAFKMKETYLHANNTSVFKPQEKNPEGETHEDLSLFSYDRNRKRIVLREFHIETFVITYVLERQEEDGVLVFLSEQIENGPAGMRTRLTLRIVDENHFEETFEIARPNQDFKVFIQNRWTRNKEKRG